MQKKALILCFFLVNFCFYAQTGPGGVGSIDGSSSLKIWLRGDDLDADADFTDNPSNGSLVSTWSDYSGNANNFTQSGGNRPTYAIGTYKAVNFNASAATAQYMNATSGGSYSNASAFFVTTPVNVSQSHTLFDGPSTSLRAEQYNNTSRVGFTRYGVADYSSSLSSPFGTRSILSFHKAAGSTTMNFRRNNGSNNVNIGVTTAGIPYNTIGKSTASTDDASGDFFEVILFNNRVNNAQRIIIQNYLSAKYGNISIQQNYYDEDNAANGNFDFKVAGIGRTNASNLHSDSKGTGIIRISNPSSLSNNDFLFWGEDVENAAYTFSGSSATNYIDRIDTKWRVSERNDVGTVTVRVNATDINFNSTDGCNQLQIVVDNNSDFSSPINTYTFTLSGGVYTATGVSFSNNNYFTLQYKDQIVLDGVTAYNGAGTLNKPNTSDDCYKLLVKSNTLTLSEDADVREVEIESGAILAVDSGYRLQVTNGVNNTGEIRLVGSSQLVQTHTGTNLNTGTGNLFVDQTASTSSAFHSGYWTSPVTTNGSTFTIDGVLKDGTVPTAATSTAGEAAAINFISGLDGDASTSPIEISKRWLAKLVNSGDWTRFLDPTLTSFNPGEGWNMKSVGATFTFKGRPNDGTYTIPISKDKFSLVGNPYPSALDSEDFIADNLSEIKGTLYIYNSASDNTHVRNAYTGSYSTISSGVTVGGGRYLPIGQAFFVTREVTGSGTVTFQNSQRENIIVSNTATIVAKETKKKKGDSKYIKNEKDFQVLRIGFELTTDDDFRYKRQLAVAFREGKTFKYENGFDGQMIDKKPSDLALKIEEKDEPFVISSIQNFDESIEIPLILELDKNREVTFKIDALENFDDVTLYLKDKQTGKSYNLSKNDVDLSLVQGKYTDRFFVTFKYELLENKEYNLVKLFLSKEKNSLIIRKSTPVDINEMRIFDINGKSVLSSKNKSTSNKIEFKLDKQLPVGIYIVKLSSDKGIITKKIGF